VFTVWFRSTKRKPWNHWRPTCALRDAQVHHPRPAWGREAPGWDTPEVRHPVIDERKPVTPRPVASPADARAAQIEFFIDQLSSVPNKRGKPYSPLTISAYRDAVISLGRYLTRTEFSGRFEDVDVPALNGYLCDYRASNSQGGTVTKSA
jgi:hypothetical protein